MPGTGTLFVVATPIGNLEDISIRALAVLGKAAIIAAEDTRRTARLLARYAIDTPTTSLHEHNERAKTPALIDRLLRGDDVALVSDAGTPTVSDPGLGLIRAAIDAGIKVEPIPGPSAALAALAASGLPAESFTFLGFPPTRPAARRAWFDRLRGENRTVIFFEAPHRIVATLNDLQPLVGDSPIVVAREMTKAHEELVRGPINEILGRLKSPRGEFTVVASIGQSTESQAIGEPDPVSMAAEIGRLTEDASISRRVAVATLAKRHGLAPNVVYKLLEQGKKLGE